MVFNSLEFLFFFPITTTIYFLIPHKYRWILLLLASCIFYMAFIPIYVIILFAMIIIDYSMGILIEKSGDRHKKRYLILSIISTCLVLFVFKYFNFFNGNIAAAADFFHWNYPIKALEIILPIGLSFHTFQSLSYVIEVYWGRQKAEKNLGIYSLYVMFYPQLVAGPIERPQNLLHQFYEKHDFEYERVTSGLRLMAWGLFKKIVIADNLAVIVNNVYNNPTNYEGLPIIIATLAFTFQIYCDFSGYSDIAIGSARVLGFKLMKNFDRPYVSKSIKEFWSRWHISLSTWFKDYVYIPLGGNKVSEKRWYFNILAVFLISGLWHGANWTFVIWGGLHGLYQIIPKVLKSIMPKQVYLLNWKQTGFYQFIQWFVTFCLVTFAWIFFRANSIDDAFYLINHLFIIEVPQNLPAFFDMLLSVGCDKYILLAIVPAFLLMEIVQFLQNKYNINSIITVIPQWSRIVLYNILILWIYTFGFFGESEFIYFQF